MQIHCLQNFNKNKPKGGQGVDGRIFGLDIQLGFDVIMQGIAVFIMFALLSYILFEPVRKILEDRKNRIADEIDQAEADQAEAAKLKPNTIIS